MIKAWVMLVCIGNAGGPCHTAALADTDTFASKIQCELRIRERFSLAADYRGNLPKHCEEITVTETAKYPPADTPCTIVGSEARGIYDDHGNCIVPFKFSRPDGVAEYCTMNDLGGMPTFSKACTGKQIEELLKSKKR